MTSIELTVRVPDDSFESKLSFPVSASRENIGEMFKGWIGALKTALDLQHAPEEKT